MTVLDPEEQPTPRRDHDQQRMRPARRLPERCRDCRRTGKCHDPFEDPAGGGGAWKCVLDPWPFYSQLDDWTVDPDKTDENASYNCGPESVAMCVKYCTGVEQPADYIKDIILGQGAVGVTSAKQLTDYLKQYCNINSDTVWCASQNNFTWNLWDAICSGKPAIWLRAFDYVGSNTLHWCPIYYIDQGAIKEADPWTGNSRWFNYADAWAWAEGTVIKLHRTRWDD